MADPSDKQKYFETPGHLVAAAVAFPIAGIVAALLRVQARKTQKQPLKADDWFILPSLALEIGIGVVLIHAVTQHALGYRVEVPPDFDGDLQDLKTDQLNIAAKTQVAYTFLLPLALGCIKLSILFFYMRIFSVYATRITHSILVGLSVLVGMWMIGFFLAVLFQCKLDVWALWGSAREIESHCTGTQWYDVVVCTTDFATDIILAIIPLPVIWRTGLSTANKMTASAVFLLGVAAIVASLIRMIMVVQLAVVGFDENEDEILAITTSLYWGMVECGTGIIAACLPVFQALFRKMSWKAALRIIALSVRYKSSDTRNDSNVSLPAI
ncbi:hypothetical protein GQ53DRAFT_819402 [Thozetella sp. PMI_491]|nr:hypothetical protein GQ53DRAFT_819402 [Thozetella sp. PMI_491]